MVSTITSLIKAAYYIRYNLSQNQTNLFERLLQNVKLLIPSMEDCRDSNKLIITNLQINQRRFFESSLTSSHNEAVYSI